MTIPLYALAAAEHALAHPSLTVLVAANEQQAYRLEEHLRFFLADRHPLIHLADTEVLPYDPFSPHQEVLSQRLAALAALVDRQPALLLVTADSWLQRLPPAAWLGGRRFDLRVGDRLAVDPFRARLVAAGYAAVSEVQTQGEFAVRGALIDLFPMGSEQAFRIDLFDEDIESIRTFDPETQRSQDKVEAIHLLPAREFPSDRDGIDGFRRRYREYFPGDPARSRIYSEVSQGQMPGGIEAYLPLFHTDTASLADYLPDDAHLMMTAPLAEQLEQDWLQIQDRFERYSGDLTRPLVRPDDLYFPPSVARRAMAAFQWVEPPTGLAPLVEPAETLMTRLADSPLRTLFVAESAGRREALLERLRRQGLVPRAVADWPAFTQDPSRFAITLGPVDEAVTHPEAGWRVIGEAALTGRPLPVVRRARATKVRDPDTLLRDLSSLHLGSPVVHVQHGVGRYAGLTTLEAGGALAEYLVLEYAGGDKVYVPVASLNLIHRYTGSEEDKAPLHSLGSERWKKARAKAREKAHDVAAELLQIQARRLAKPGEPIVWDDDDYQRFCAGFPFEPTPDQQTAIEAVLADLASDKPMDRVVCGDVGFGKTEVALRAVFAAARAGRQVCLLAPTTLLVEQHAKNFADRFADWPLRVAALSRMRTGKEQTALLKQLEEGSLDVIIGTHRLLQPDIRFHKLGLVVVDEEHRFGVRHKETLKNLRANVDLLTLTATPIPRTLNMSLAGLRDLSIIATPPASRIAIKTTVAEWDNALVVEACQRELRRGGQIYVLHNEVTSIERFSANLRELVPEARIRVAHGQMRERELEQVMLDFYHQRFNVLVCTTIIESGIDVPSANTILIDRADKLGLAQLHQLRGRVGRSHHRAYAYLLVPSLRGLSADAQKRLDAIESLGDLGSGFALATHDLEIRGAGELLGDDQSGQIEEVGFTLYAELLARAVKAIQRGALDDSPFGSSECEVDLGIAALIPDDYVPDIATRLTLYKRISEAESADILAELRVEMIDRFGLLPPPAERLFDQANLRIALATRGFRRLRIGERSATLDFGSAPRFDPLQLIKLIQTDPRRYKLEGQKCLHVYLDFAEPATRAERLMPLFDALPPAPRPEAPA
ncbi:transcription-repair coupling factor [Flagellatimonas centrodinii]|uniref:transcription-repair coupling factor n=1 Tax=Flagellatimonas centrodinii TaxID=2806210 RepID=UPI001FEF2EA8|nr:transcription-repair coupling factor [Flagellatimonas centrodinii]ULQ46556.1 transcription-repair coupling factor [Flagellatimonas centrodinii]